MPANHGGRVHRTLRRLSQGPCGFTLLMQATRLEGERAIKARSRLRGALRFMLEQGYAYDDGRTIYITPDGERFLADLDQMPTSRPSVRVFATGVAA